MSFFLFFLSPPSLAGAEGVGLSTNWAGERDGTGRGKRPIRRKTFQGSSADLLCGEISADLLCSAASACRLYSPIFALGRRQGPGTSKQPRRNHWAAEAAFAPTASACLADLAAQVSYDSEQVL